MPYKDKCIGATIVFVGLTLVPCPAHPQAIPVELMGGHRYATVNLVMSRGLDEASRLGFFHQHTLTVDYDNGEQAVSRHPSAEHL